MNLRSNNEAPSRSERTAMKIYRIEDKDGCGPWQCECLASKEAQSLLDDALSPLEDREDFPGPARDGLTITPNTVFGCLGLAQLHEWFPEPAWTTLESLGFLVVVYDVPPERVHYGRVQVGFDPGYATTRTELEKHPPPTDRPAALMSDFAKAFNDFAQEQAADGTTP